MKIVIDARMYGLEHAGIGRYVMNLIGQLEKLDQKNDYFLLLKKSQFKSLRLKNPHFKKILADYPHYSFQEQIRLPLQLIKLKPDLVHFPHFNIPIFWRGKQAVTIHDLIKHHSRGRKTTTRWQPFYWLKFVVYQNLVKLAVKKAQAVIVPSQHWRQELMTRFQLPPGKVKVTYEGVGDRFKPISLSSRAAAEILKRYRIKKPFVIYTGSLYPHKNVARLVQAVKQIPGLFLVIVCARNVFYERFQKEVQKMGAEKQVNLVGFVPDQELAVLYHRAEAFVLPTLMEGFGLIGLEAMAAGCPVLASEIPVLKEVYGQAALFFNPLSLKEMKTKIKTVVGHKEEQARLRKLGFMQAKKYSWQKMARQTLKIYEGCLSL